MPSHSSEQRPTSENRIFKFRRKIFGSRSNRRPPVRQQPLAAVRRRPPGHRGSVFAENSGRDFDFRRLRKGSGDDRRQLGRRFVDDGAVHSTSLSLRQLHRDPAEAFAQEAKDGSHFQRFASHRNY